MLGKVHEKFIASITDDYVRELVDKNAIITGGAIASMLLNENVNDYDYYFRDAETVLAVAEYYVKIFNETNDCDTFIETSKGKITIKNVSYKDVLDLDVDDFESATSDDIGDYMPIFVSENAITLNNKIQIVLRFYGEPEWIHENYDFVHCTNYYIPSKNELSLNPKALESLLTRELRYMGSKYPICSIIRTRKFIKRGWSINAGQYLKMCYQIGELDLNDLDVLEEQLVGVDIVYFIELLQILRDKKDKDPDFILDHHHLSVIIDEIF